MPVVKCEDQNLHVAILGSSARITCFDNCVSKDIGERLWVLLAFVARNLRSPQAAGTRSLPPSSQAVQGRYPAMNQERIRTQCSKAGQTLVLRTLSDPFCGCCFHGALSHQWQSHWDVEGLFS